MAKIKDKEFEDYKKRQIERLMFIIPVSINVQEKSLNKLLNVMLDNSYLQGRIAGLKKSR